MGGPQADTAHPTLSCRSRAQPSWMSAAMTSVFPATVARCKAVCSPCRVGQRQEQLSAPPPAPHHPLTLSSILTQGHVPSLHGTDWSPSWAGHFVPKFSGNLEWDPIHRTALSCRASLRKRFKHSAATTGHGSVQQDCDCQAVKSGSEKRQCREPWLPELSSPCSQRRRCPAVSVSSSQICRLTRTGQTDVGVYTMSAEDPRACRRPCVSPRSLSGYFLTASLLTYAAFDPFLWRQIPATADLLFSSGHLKELSPNCTREG